MGGRFYVYAGFYPTGDVCYIGKGSGQRWAAHLLRSHNVVLRRIVAKAGGSIPIAIIRDDLEESQAYEIEKALIVAIKRGEAC